MSILDKDLRPEVEGSRVLLPKLAFLESAAGYGIAQLAGTSDSTVRRHFAGMLTMQKAPSSHRSPSAVKRLEPGGKKRPEITARARRQPERVAKDRLVAELRRRAS